MLCCSVGTFNVKKLTMVDDFNYKNETCFISRKYSNYLEKLNTLGKIAFTNMHCVLTRMRSVEVSQIVLDPKCEYVRSLQTLFLKFLYHECHEIKINLCGTQSSHLAPDLPVIKKYT